MTLGNPISYAANHRMVVRCGRVRMDHSGARLTNPSYYAWEWTTEGESGSRRRGYRFLYLNRIRHRDLWEVSEEERRKLHEIGVFLPNRFLGVTVKDVPLPALRWSNGNDLN